MRIIETRALKAKCHAQDKDLGANRSAGPTHWRRDPYGQRRPLQSVVASNRHELFTSKEEEYSRSTRHSVAGEGTLNDAFHLPLVPRTLRTCELTERRSIVRSGEPYLWRGDDENRQRQARCRKRIGGRGPTIVGSGFPPLSMSCSSRTVGQTSIG